jgi:uncharacterized protein (TIGR03435 family)
MHRILAGCSAAIVLGAASMAVFAQQATPVQPEQKKITLADLKEENFHFEVASIHPNKSGDNSMSWRSDPNNFNMTNVSLDLLVRDAYGITAADALVNLPSWAESERINVNAKVDESTFVLYEQLSREERKLFIHRLEKNLLAERFRLKAHTETRVLPAYDLVIAKGGIKMKEDASEKGWTRMQGGPETKLETHARNIASLVDNLSVDIDRKVIDKTGLGEKKFTFTLIWTPERRQTTENPGTSIYAALQEQLGLKLVATKAPVEVVVVDHIEKPSEN